MRTLASFSRCDFLNHIELLALNIKNAVPGTPRFDRVVDLLLEVAADVVVLTECGPEAFDTICLELDATSAVYAPADFWGNGIISLHHPLLNGGEVDLTTFSEHRSAAVALVEIDEVCTVQIVATHFEVSDETSRLRQIEILDQEIGIRESVIVGDLNALNRRDYDKDRLNELVEIRHQGGKHSPRWDVLDCLLDVHDCVDAANGQPFQPTTPYASRVDYFLFGSQSGVQHMKNSYRVIDCLSNDISDHNAIVCVITAS